MYKLLYVLALVIPRAVWGDGGDVLMMLLSVDPDSNQFMMGELSPLLPALEAR